MGNRTFGEESFKPKTILQMRLCNLQAIQFANIFPLQVFSIHRCFLGPLISGSGVPPMFCGKRNFGQLFAHYLRMFFSEDRYGAFRLAAEHGIVLRFLDRQRSRVFVREMLLGMPTNQGTVVRDNDGLRRNGRRIVPYRSETEQRSHKAQSP